MKKFSALLSFLILFTAFTCENEPLDGDFVIDDGTNPTLSCAEATQNTVTATIDFVGVTPDDANYTQLCLAYKNALQDQIDACGDDGTLQAIINSLGNCGDDNQPNDCETATNDADEAETAYSNDNTNADLCNDYKTALQNQITACGDADGSIQAIIDGLGDCLNSSTNVLCNGNGSNSLFPLAIGNQWEYSATLGGLDLQLDINLQETINNQEYFFLESSGPGSYGNKYLRIDADGNIYETLFLSSQGDYVEKLYLPSNPTLNQEWDYYASCANPPCSGFKKVESVDAVVETDDCIYYDCIVVRKYIVFSNGDVSEQDLRIYKQGIGIVDGIPLTELTGVILN